MSEMFVKCSYLVSKRKPAMTMSQPIHSSLPPSLPPQRTLNRAGDKTSLLLLQIVENRRGILPVHVHLVHDGEGGLEAVLDEFADLGGGVRLLALMVDGGREGGRDGGEEG